MPYQRLFQVCWRCADGTVLRGTQRFTFRDARDDARIMTRIDGRQHWAAPAVEDDDELFH